MLFCVLAEIELPIAGILSDCSMEKLVSISFVVWGFIIKPMIF
ncbi:hypothetical protein [Clostridium sp.]